ncbi:unnamed protein product, partial [Brachionus calyciflorus]
MIKLILLVNLFLISCAEAKPYRAFCTNKNPLFTRCKLRNLRNKNFYRNETVIFFDLQKYSDIFTKSKLRLFTNDSEFDHSTLNLIFSIKYASTKLINLKIIPQIYMRKNPIFKIKKIKIRNFASKTRLVLEKSFFESLKSEKFVVLNRNNSNSLELHLDSDLKELKFNSTSFVKFENLIFSENPVFSIPRLAKIIFKSVDFISSNNSKCRIECSCLNMSEISGINYDYQIYIDKEICLPTNLSECLKCTPYDFHNVILRHRRGANLLLNKSREIDADTFSNNLYDKLGAQLKVFFVMLIVILIIYSVIGVKYLRDKINTKDESDSGQDDNDKSRASVTSAQSGVSEKSGHLKRMSSSHKFAMDNLKKRPSKSILLTPERKSLQIEAKRASMMASRASVMAANRASIAKQVTINNSENEDSSATNLIDRNSVGIRGSNVTGDDDNDLRKSFSKSVSFNEKTK